MQWKMEVWVREEFIDAAGESAKRDLNDLGYASVERVRVGRVYDFQGELSSKEAERVSTELLSDPITEVTSCREPVYRSGGSLRVIEIGYNPGVMDTVAQSTMKAVRDLGIGGVTSARTGTKYAIWGGMSENDILVAASKLFYNPLIQHVIKEEEKAVSAVAYRFELVTVPLSKATDAELLQISRSGQLSLNLEEMNAIRKHFLELGREPTDIELETIAQTWSEHCVHKTFRGIIEYEGERIEGLLKSTIMRATEQLNKEWCVSVFEDNSGAISFDAGYDVCFKVETHNHPSALEPYGGAGTGIGGVIRDPLGTGLGAKPIINTDVFCFAPPDYPAEDVPRGVLHPKRVMKGVVAGVRDYGNRMGIPTSNGAVLFDPAYLGNPVVYCGNVGLLPKGKSRKNIQAGHLIVLVGGRTGRDGIHGVTFASVELHEESESLSAQAVQIGNPIEEKRVTDAILKARDLGLYSGITDCGGGGLSSAVGETAKAIGAEVNLEKVPLKYEGLSYWEIWISEAQERMVLAVPEEKLEELLGVFDSEGVEATVIGRYTGDRKLVLKYEGNRVADMDMEFLHAGYPIPTKEANWKKPSLQEPDFEEPEDLTGDLMSILSSWNVCSKEWVVRQYDHEVQGGSVVKPLTGAANDGPSDASVTRPVLDSYRGVVISCGINPRYGLIDPYWMAASAVDEALRNQIAVGGSLNRVALLDNFSWGNPDIPERLGALVRAAKACYDASMAYGCPFISGKDSLNNEYRVGEETISIPPTLLISAMGVMDDVRKAKTMDVKEAGNLIYVVGKTHDELGGSHYYLVHGELGCNVPGVDFVDARSIMRALSDAAERGLIRSIHDCSEGGIGVASAEMAFAGGLGMEIDLPNVPLGDAVERNDKILFSESNTRFIAEVREKDRSEFEAAMRNVAAGLLGKVIDSKAFIVKGVTGKPVVKTDIGSLKEAWQRSLRW
ncbi:MAG: phosphoribosylformylglycinamidine synthase subunit PurL [bacterium]